MDLPTAILTMSLYNIKVTFNAEKKDSIPYSDKIMRVSFRPSLCHFAKKPVDGWLAVTTTGLVRII